MSINFRKSKSFGGLKFNLGKSGIGVSTGIKGFRVGINSKGKSYSSISIPGTGINYRNSHAKTNSNENEEFQFADLLGFQYNKDKYGQSDTKGCLMIIVWIVSIFLIAFVGIGFITTIGLIIYTIIQRRKPDFKFKKKFSEAYNQARVGETEKALSLLKIADFYKPNEIDLIDLQGVCFKNTSQFKEAKSNFEKLLSKYPNNERYKYIYIEILREVDNKDDYPKIIEAYEKYYNEDPKDEYLFLIGHYNILLSDFDKSIYYLQKISNKSHLYLYALLGMATCFYAKGQIDLSIEILNKAPLKTKNLSPELLKIHYNLGNYYEEKGEKELAKAMYQKVYLHDVNYSDVKLKLEELNK